MDFKKALKTFIGDEEKVKSLESEFNNLSKKEKEKLKIITDKLTVFFEKNIVSVMQITSGKRNLDIIALTAVFCDKFLKEFKNEKFTRLDFVEYVKMFSEAFRFKFSSFKDEKSVKKFSKERIESKLKKEPEGYCSGTIGDYLKSKKEKNNGKFFEKKK